MVNSGWRTLGSSRHCLGTVPCYNSTFDESSFGVAGPRLWNDLPKDLRNTGLSIGTFGKHLRTLTFSVSWGHSAFVTIRFLCAVYKRTYLLTIYTLTYQYTQNPRQSTVLDAGSVVSIPGLTANHSNVSARHLISEPIGTTDPAAKGIASNINKLWC